MDNININIKKSKSTRKINQNKIPKYNEDKRKSDGVAGNLFLNKFKGNHNNKANKIPINHRLSIQDSNMFAFSKFINNIKSYNNEKPKKKDKDYYLNLLNNIYSNESHLSNNNVIKNNNKKKECNIIKKYDEKISMNTPKVMNYKNNFKFIRKDSKKKLSILSQDQKCEQNNSINELDKCIKDDKSTKKEINKSNEAKDSKSTKRFLSQKTVSKFNVKHGLKFKKKENKSSKKEDKIIADELKDEIILEGNKEIIKNENINHINNKKESKNNDKEETELDIDNIKNPPNNEILKNKSNKKQNETCFLCCFTVKDDSFIN
jgi:hypothetical protein